MATSINNAPQLDEEKAAGLDTALAGSEQPLPLQDDSEPSSIREIPPTKWSLGVLNDPETSYVPGTVLLITDQNSEPGASEPKPTSSGADDHSQQRRGSDGQKLTKDGSVILVPQPDDSHNDPLNWPGWKRDLALLSLGIYCMVGGGMTTVLAAGFTNVAETFNTTTSRVALTTGLYMTGLGVGSVFASPTAIIFGKRPVYLFGAFMYVATSAWCAASPSFTSLLVARVFQGISVCPVECLPSSTISEIFFLHERAFRIGVYTLLLLGGKNLIPLVSAVIIQSLSWRWVFWICCFVGGFCWAILFFFVPETFWDRTQAPHSNSAPSGTISMGGTTVAGSGLAGFTPESSSDPEKGSSDVAEPGTAAQSTPADISPTLNPETTDLARVRTDFTTERRNSPPLRYIQHLKPFHGKLNHDNWFHIAIRPFILFTYPTVLWSAAVYGFSVGWLIVLSESVSTLYRTPQTYNFSALSAGLVYISPFIGGILGTVASGKVSDYIVRVMAKRNGGVYEPEFRLVMAIPVVISTVIGLMGFGWSDSIHDSFIVPTIFFGIISFGCTLGSTTAIAFCVDSYRQYAGEMLVTLNFTKNIFHGLSFSLFYPNWLSRDGAKSVFIWIGVIHLILMSTSIPMYIFGKRSRMWTHRKNLMEKF